LRAHLGRLPHDADAPERQTSVAEDRAALGCSMRGLEALQEIASCVDRDREPVCRLVSAVPETDRNKGSG
jgi:hypothetical protein